MTILFEKTFCQARKATVSEITLHQSGLTSEHTACLLGTLGSLKSSLLSIISISCSKRMKHWETREHDRGYYEGQAFIRVHPSPSPSPSLPFSLLSSSLPPSCLLASSPSPRLFSSLSFLYAISPSSHIPSLLSVILFIQWAMFLLNLDKSPKTTIFIHLLEPFSFIYDICMKNKCQIKYACIAFSVSEWEQNSNSHREDKVSLGWEPSDRSSMNSELTPSKVRWSSSVVCVHGYMHMCLCTCVYCNESVHVCRGQDNHGCWS